MTEHPESKRSTRQTLLTGAAIVLAAIVAHFLALQAGWIWDDNDYITANPVLQSDDGWFTSWVPGATPQYYPLVFLGFWVEYAIAGGDPLLYHATNLLMHASSALLLWGILARIGVRRAEWIAVIFAVHPMGVETVAWATERKNAQSLMFALSSISCFTLATRAEPKSVLALHISAFVLFVCALLSKTTAVFVAPALVLIALWERRRIDVRFALTVLPYFVVGAALGLFTVYVEKVHVGARGSEFALSMADRVQLAARNVVFYIGAYFVPVDQMFVYPRWTVDASRIALWVPFAALLAVAVVAGVAWKRTRGPILVGLWLCAALFPALGFFDVWPFRFSFVADHFAYAAMPALAATLVFVVASVVERSGGASKQVNIALATAAIILVPLSWRAASKYENVELLWRETIAQNPSAWLAQNNLATELLGAVEPAMAAGDQARVRALATEALEHATRAYELKPDECTHPANRSEALRLLGRNDEALVAMDAAIAVAPHLPEFQWMRGRILETMDRNEDARAAYLKAAEDPLDHSYELTSRLAMVRLAANRKDYPDAIAQCRKAIALDPTNADNIANLASLLAANGEEKAGRLEYLHALGPNVGFSDERLMVATAIRYLRLAINAPIEGSEILTAHALAKQLATKSSGDVSARFLVRAVELIQGDASARADIEKMLAQSREAKADRFAEEVEKFLRTHPAAK